MTGICDAKKKILKKGSCATVSEDHFEGCLAIRTGKEAPENEPIDNCQNIPLDVLGQYGRDRCNKCAPRRFYNKSKSIEDLSIKNYRQSGKWICYKDLLSNGLAKHKRQAQAKLKYCCRSNILFTPYNHKPQRYYPTCLKSEILSKIIPVGAIGVGLSSLPLPPSLFQGNSMDNATIGSNRGLDTAIMQTLEGYVLPLLPEIPLHIHKMHFKVRIQREYYQEIVLPVDPRNKGKEHEELIGRTLVRYRFYANGTVVVSTESSNNPFPLATEFDLSNFMAFLGQVRDRLVLFIADKHERIVPNIMDWELTQCDLNRDVHIERCMLQPIGLSIQVRHLSHLFRVYIKTKGADTVCRVEESVTPKGKSVVESVNDIFNPTERLEKQIADLTSKVDQFLVYCSNQDSRNYEVERNQFQSTVKGRSTN